MPGSRAQFQVEAAHLAEGDVAVIVLRGELDLASADRLRASLEAALEGGAQTVRVDATGVTLLDSTSLGVLLFFARRLNETGGVLELAFSSPGVRRTLQLAALGRSIRLVRRDRPDDGTWSFGADLRERKPTGVG
ncbi:MAG: anti-sigma factor antagonist [Gaiellales bacterium]|jgi:anti-anti-sigma factor|nr:anti-sigma factor antagonist [Gaiellales bacterium]MDX6591981.1 anti-sigma factor antagonist [Gaiellales bacterium]